LQERGELTAAGGTVRPLGRAQDRTGVPLRRGKLPQPARAL
jgi:hypothetical protein